MPVTDVNNDHETSVIHDFVFPSIIQIESGSFSVPENRDINSPVTGAAFNLVLPLEFSSPAGQLTAKEYPVLASVWDNDDDAELYDNL
jgi:hypothetical protein